MAGRRGRGAVTRELRPGSISRSLSYPRSRLGRIQPRTDAPAYSGGIDGLAVRTTENFAVSFRASGAWPDLGNVARAATRPRRHHRARRAGPPDVPGGCADCSDATCLELARKIAQHTEPVVEPRRNRRARADVRHVLHRHAGVSVGEMRVVSTSSTTGSNRSADISAEPPGTQSSDRCRPVAERARSCRGKSLSTPTRWLSPVETSRGARADVGHVLHRHASVSVDEMRVVSTSSTTGPIRSADIFR